MLCSAIRSISCRRLAVFLGILGFSLAVQAQTDFTIEVNSLTDTGRDGSASAGVCTTGSTVTCPSGTCTECTLRAAIETVNTLTVIESASIVFADYIPTNSGDPVASMFEPVNGYNSIGREVHIDGTSHPNWDPADGIPRVIVRGDSAISTANGLNFGPGGADSTVNAIAVYNFPQIGIRINADNVTVRQSHVGINANGTSARPNAVGIAVLGEHNVIGHEPVFAGGGLWPNIISGNTGAGIEVSGDQNLVGGNFIGLNKAGISAVGNGGPGIVVEGTHARVGDQSFSGGDFPVLLTTSNVVAGNSGDQVRFEAGADSGQVACTRVGTNASGTARVGFGTGTALRLHSSSNQVGNTHCPNIFAGEVAMGQGGASPITVNFNTFEYNYVGTNADGDDLGEDMVGVYVFTGQGHQILNNTIGNGLTGLAVAGGVINTIIQSNHIGVDADGTALPILFEAIRDAGSGTQIGGSDANLGNRLGNAARGIDNLASSSAATIQNNWIGALSDGTLAPVDIAIRVSGGDHLIGFAGSGNRIANATDAGIELTSGSTAALVRGNRIGSTSRTAGGFGDDSVGILVSGSSHVVSDENHVGSQHTGILVDAGSHEIVNNRIGFDADLTPRPNASFGIRLASGSSDNWVIGNSIGNSTRGLRINAGSSNNVIGGNWIGVVPPSVAMGNDSYGLYTTGSNNWIGVDPVTGDNLPNVFGFNGSNGGVRIGGPDTTVVNNWIGLSPSCVNIGNVGDGMRIMDNPAGSSIGLSSSSNANWIGRNGGHGIAVLADGEELEINVNHIGFCPSVDSQTGNSGSGIFIGPGVSDVAMRSTPDFELGTLTIANNAMGVEFHPDAGTGNRIQRVRFANNAGKAIDLGPGGRDQDPGDADTGPNNLQNFPEIDLSASEYDSGTDQVNVRFRVDSIPGNSAYPISVGFFRVGNLDNPQPYEHIGTLSYLETDAQTFVIESFEPLIPLDESDLFVAIATDVNGNTSEVSEVFGALEFSVGGTVFNLEGEGLVLDLNGEEQLPISGSGDIAFQFNLQAQTGAGYEVTVAQQPEGQLCSVINGEGSGDGSDVDDVVVDCCAITDRIFHDRFDSEAGGAEAATFCPLVGISQAQAALGHTCALRVDGTVWCWGVNQDGQLGDGGNEDSLIPVQVVRSEGQPLTDIRAISSKSSHVCALDATDRAWCWGSGSSGQLGNGMIEDRNHASLVMTSDQEALSGIARISAGDAHSCAVLNDGTAWCWGSRLHGRLGDGGSTTGLAPHPVQVERNVDQEPLLDTWHIEAGRHYSCAIAGGGDAWCWGRNENGQLGNNGQGDFQNRAVRVQEQGTFQLIVDALDLGGHRANCMVRDPASAWCWGLASEGQTGDGVDGDDTRLMAVRVVRADDTSQPLADVQAIQGGWFHSCAIAGTDDGVYCWGSQFSGRLGNGQSSGSINAAQPVIRVEDGAPLTDVDGVSIGISSGCAVTSDSRLRCWGNNMNGRIGVGSLTIHTRATYVRRPAGVW